jgi:hypothetical protein
MFVVPAHGRLELAEVCLRTLRWTCDELTAAGIDSSAIVVACDENLAVARELGFAKIRISTFNDRRRVPHSRTQHRCWISAARAQAMNTSTVHPRATTRREGRLFMSMMDSNWPKLIQLHQPGPASI